MLRQALVRFAGILHRTLAIARHEIAAQFYAPLTYIFIAGFTAVLSLSVFQIADFFVTDEVTMRTWKLFLPWVGVIFVPAMAMRMWPDEHSDRSVELALTIPVNIGELAAGKYLAGLFVLLIMLAATAIFPATLFYLGSPDGGLIFSTYLAAFFLLGLFLAVATLVGTICREPISVFVVSCVVLFFASLLGASELDTVFTGVVPSVWMTWLEQLMPRYHFESLGSGLVQWSDAIYFVGGSCLLVICAAAVIDIRRHSNWKAATRSLPVRIRIVLAISIIGVASVLAKWPAEWDLTEQKEFTLSPVSIQKLNQATGPLSVTMYWSASQANVPASIQSHAARVQRLLQRITYRTGGNISFTTIDPEPDSSAELIALEAGMQLVPMSSGDYFFLGVAMEYAGRRIVKPYMDIARESYLEYDLMAALTSLVEPDTVRVGVVSALLKPTSLQTPRPGLSFLSELKQRYDVSIVPFFDSALPAELDVLLVIQGTVLKSDMLMAIDHFVTSGGTLIALMDPNVRFDRPSNEIEFAPSIEINDLSDLLLAYGLRYQGDAIIGDAALASPVAIGDDSARVGFPYWMRFGPGNLGNSHGVTSGLNDILIVEAGHFEMATESVEDASRIMPVLSTTHRTGAHSRENYSALSALDLATGFAEDNNALTVAAVIDGGITSAYGEVKNSASDGPVPQSGKLFAVADIDWLFDPFSLQTTAQGGGSVVRPLNDNLAFLHNMIAYGAGKDLTAIPNRGSLSRPFTRVEKLLKSVSNKVRTDERNAVETVEELEKKLNEVRAVSGVDNLSALPEPLRGQALLIQRELVAMRQTLRNTRLLIRQQVDQLGQRIAVSNTVSGPLVAFLLYLLVQWRRKVR